MIQKAKRVLVIGLDGATFNLIRPWIREGRLPNLAKLLENGVSGELESTIPPVTFPAWMSFATGKNPGKLGIYDLTKRRKSSYIVQLANPGSLREKLLWNILNDYVIRTGIVNVPGTFPPREVDGFMITGMFTPSERENFCYPTGLKTKLNLGVGKYELDVDHWKYFDEGRFLKDINRVTAKREKVAEYLIKAFDVQFFMIVFTSPDRIQHVMWKYMDANHPQHDLERAQQYSNAIKAYWQKLDRIVGKLIWAFGDEGTVLVLSDHGFGPRTKTFYVNEWLRQIGFLKLRDKVEKSLLAGLGRIITKLYYSLGKTRVYHSLAHLVFRLLGRNLVYDLVFKYVSFEEMIGRIDWTQTKAFSLPHTAHFGQIYINLKGRDPQGCVQPSDYEKVRNEIIDKLGRLEDPLSGEKLRTDIYKPEEIYSGLYVNEAPDIIFTVNNSECEVDVRFGHASLFLQGSFDLRHTGTHKKEGIFIASGPDIKKGTEITGAKIIDITPTILHLFGIPIPRDMDGRVLREIFKENSDPAARKVRFSGLMETKEKEIFTMPEEDERKIRQRLRRLGYST